MHKREHGSGSIVPNVVANDPWLELQLNASFLHREGNFHRPQRLDILSRRSRNNSGVAQLPCNQSGRLLLGQMSLERSQLSGRRVEPFRVRLASN